MITEEEAMRRSNADLSSLFMVIDQQMQKITSAAKSDGTPVSENELPTFSLDHNWSNLEKLVLKAVKDDPSQKLLKTLLQHGIVRRLMNTIYGVTALATSYEFKGLDSYDPLIGSVSFICHRFCTPLHVLPTLTDDFFASI